LNITRVFIYKTRLGNVITRGSGELYNGFGASFVYVCIIMTMNLSFLKSHEFSASTSDTPLDKLSMGFSLVTSRVILDQCNINIFVMVILHFKKMY